MRLKRWLILLTLGGLLEAQALPDDPVMKARSQRAQAQGIDEADLPPVPRNITEPPPLPPPEIHVKDTPGGQAKAARRHGGRASARVAGKAGARAGKRSKGAGAVQQGSQSRHSQAGVPLGKKARKPGKRVKP
jgi:hypothetical protein